MSSALQKSGKIFASAIASLVRNSFAMVRPFAIAPTVDASHPQAGTSRPTRPISATARGRDTPKLRAATTFTSAMASVQIDGKIKGTLPQTIVVDGTDIANPTIFLIECTDACDGQRLWARDAYQAYQKWAQLSGSKAGSFDQLGRAATALGWERGKSSEWYYRNRTLK